MTQTVWLQGYMFGPIVSGSGGPEDREYDYIFTNSSDTRKEIRVNWRNDIYGIDKYTRPVYADEGWDEPGNMGERKIQLAADSALVGSFITGEIEGFYVTPEASDLNAWQGPNVVFGVGPQGTTYPPCICPK